MDRRHHLKLLLTGSFGAGFLMSGGCTEEDRRTSEELIRNGGGYGRTPEEIAYDNELRSEKFLTDREMQMVAILADIIIPADESSGSATEVGVPEFIEFMMKDFPPFQVPTRGGLMWLNNQCRNRFGSEFTECSEAQRMEVIEDIAWPDSASPEMEYGVRFFNRMRNLTATGFFTSEEGIGYLGYMGNRPGFWDGVPDEVLRKHGLSYDQKTLDECIKAEERSRVAEWDDDANLLNRS